ncbi:MAG: hypothetical protein R6U25_00425 [Alkalispirochaeta sp.]
MSSRISIKDDLTLFVHTVDEISRIAEAGETVPLILHPVGLSSFIAGDRSATDEVSRLHEICARESVQLWNGGYAGAPGDHLTAEELAWDLTWARTNPWDTGLTRLLGTAPTADFPVLVTDRHAGQLGTEHMPHQGPLCLGYAADTPAPPAGGPRQLWFWEDGTWTWLTSLILGVSEETELPPVDSIAPADCVHLILSRSSAAGITSRGTPAALRDHRSPAAPAMPPRRVAATPPSGTFFHSGVDRRGRWLKPDRAAAVARIRASRAVSRERTAAVLRAAAGVATPLAETEATSADHDPFQNRELQGGVTGRLRLDTDSVGALFSAGRLAGFTYGDTALTPLERCQGFRQTSRTTGYLETLSAAWFTGLRVRGVHEVAEIPGDLRLGITTFAMDQLPGLALNITAERGVASVQQEGRENVHDQEEQAEALLRHAPLEIPLYDMGDSFTALRGAILDSTGEVREITLFPQPPTELSERTSPLEWSVGATGVRLDLPAASLWIIAAHPGTALPVPFLLGARSIPQGTRISWYPIGFERTALDADRHCRKWSVSYRILATGQDTKIPIFPRVEHDLATEIDGFTCQAGGAGRSVPAI